jgi:hypothetical protein
LLLFMDRKQSKPIINQVCIGYFGTVGTFVV